jgi:hypothetical protein
MDSRRFTQTMQRFSDDELVEIASFGEKDGYLPQAVVAARNELAARNLSPTDSSTVVDCVETRRTRAAELASQPLSWPARIAFFILPIFGWPILAFVAWSLGTRGYRQKSSDAWKWMGLGIAFCVALIVVLVACTF